MRRVLGALVLVVIVVAPARADTAAKRDPNDVGGPLDIKRISHGHAGDDALWHKVVMYKRWGKNDLEGEEIRFYFSRDKEDRFDEVHASVALKDGKLRAWIFGYTEGSDFAAVGPSKRIPLRRPDRRSIKIFVPEKWLDNKRDRYVWSVGSSFKDRDSNKCRRVCFDYAPGSNPDRLEHRL